MNDMTDKQMAVVLKMAADIASKCESAEEAAEKLNGYYDMLMPKKTKKKIPPSDPRWENPRKTSGGLATALCP